jgi:hypothetical protein
VVVLSDFALRPPARSPTLNERYPHPAVRSQK